MKQTMQKALAFLLVCVMLVGMMPIGAMAAETEASARATLSYPVITPNTDTWANIKTSGLCAHFQFTPTVTAEYTFYSTGYYDTAGVLMDENLNILAENYDSGEELNFSIVYTLEAGNTYILQVYFEDVDRSGSFIVRLDVDCDHEYTTTEFEATCSDDGYTVTTCTLCGATETTYTDDALGHDFVKDVCTRCGRDISIYPEIVPDTDVLITPTSVDEIVYFKFTPPEDSPYTFCSTGNYDTRGAIYDVDMNLIRANHDAEWDVNFSITENLTGGVTYILAAQLDPYESLGSFTVRLTKECAHAYTSEVTPPTCTEIGYTTYTCTLCGDSYTDIHTAPWGHRYENRACVRCGEPVPTYETIALNTETEAVISAAGDVARFTFVPEITGEYTFCSMGDYDTYGYIYDENLEIIAHNDDGNYDYNFSINALLQAGTTYILGARFYNSGRTGSFNIELISPCDHEYASSVTAPTCTQQGYTTHTCTLCGYAYLDTYTATVAHSYQDGYCTGCGAEELNYPTLQLNTETPVDIAEYGQNAYFFFTPAESAEYHFRSYGSCDTYGYIYDSNMNRLAYNDDDDGRNFGIAYYLEAGVTYILCTRLYYGDAIGSFTVKITQACSHEYTSQVIEPTCTDEGYTLHTCTLCGESYKDQYRDARDHSWEDNVCTVCGLTRGSILLNTDTTVTIENRGETVQFYFTPAETATYVFYSISDFDTFGLIYDEDFNVLVENDDSEEDWNFEIRYVLEAGTTYVLGAKFLSSSITGSFTVRLTKECTHVYDSVVTESTCTARGYTTYTCTLCGHSYKSDYTAVLGHSIAGTSCSRCGVDIPVIELNTETLAYVPGSGTIIYFLFTPEEDANYTFYSDSNYDTIGYIYDADMNELNSDDDSGSSDNFSVDWDMEAGKTYILAAKFYYLDFTGTMPVRVIKTCLHEYVETVIDATCTEMGQIHQTCIHCGDSMIYDYIDPLDHCSGSSVCSRCGLDVYALQEVEADNIISLPDVDLDLDRDHLYFRFTPDETGYYKIYTTGDYDTYGSIYDDQLNNLCSNGGFGYDENFTIYKKFIGGRTYMISIDRSYYWDYGDSYLHIDTLDAAPMELNTTMSAEIAEGGERVYFSFTPTESGRYIYYSESSENSYGFIYDADRNMLDYDEYSPNGNDFFFVANLTAGTNYLLSAMFYDTTLTGDISITLEKIPVPETVPLVPDTEFIVNIDHRAGYASFTFTPTESGPYRFYSLGTMYTRGHIYDSNMEQVASHWGDYYEDRNFNVTANLKAGETYTFVTALGYPYQTGSFRIRLDQLPLPEFHPIELNESTEVTITTPGETVYFSFTPSETAGYKFYSTSNYIYDTYGYIYDSDLQILAENDDGGNNYQFHVSWRMEAGTTYILGARLLGDNTGIFNVHLDKESQGEPDEPVVPDQPEDPIQIVTQPENYVGLVGDMASFSVEAEGEGLTYRWEFSQDNGTTWEKASSTTNTLSFEFKAYRLNYLYRCVITDAEGNSITTDIVELVADEVDLVILTQPESFVGAVNDNVTFAVEATGNGLTYEWFYSTDGGETWEKSYSPGYLTNTLAPILRSHRDGNMYKCVVTDVLGNSVESDVVSMSVETDEIIIVSQPVSVENAVLSQLYGYSVVAEGVNLTYRWQLSTDGGETWEDSWNQGYNTPNLSVRMNANRDGNLYRCAITSGQKLTVYTDVVILDMQDPSVELIGQSGNVFVTANKTATFTVEAEGMDLTYLWYRSNDKGATWNQTYLSGYNTNTLSFVGNVGRAAMYMCKITDGSGTVVWSSPVNLQILSAELKILSQPVSATCAAGETVSFHVDAQGDSLKYQWYSFDGVEWKMSYLPGYNTDTFSFEVNASRASKSYKCIITDAAGNTVETDVVSVTIA